MSVASVIDTSGVAVVTGGASGFGLAVAGRLVRRGAPVALLDVSAGELAEAARRLRVEAPQGPGHVLAIRCDVASFADCEAARRQVAEAFPDRPVAFLFNNAGIAGREGGKILRGPPEGWAPVFSVNVFGAVNIIKAFLPGMIEGGPLASGKKSFVVTTSSVVGLVHHNIGPYSVSKFACTAMCEQLSIELELMGAKAAHVSPHVLHPSVGGTNFLSARGPDGSFATDEAFKELVMQAGAFSADDIADGLFRGLEEGHFCIVVDHEFDIPSSHQIAMRLEDQMQGRKPRRPQQIGVMLAAQDPEAFRARRADRLPPPAGARGRSRL